MSLKIREGFGVRHAGWGGVPPPPTCNIKCNDGNECTSDSKNDCFCTNKLIPDKVKSDQTDGNCQTELCSGSRDNNGDIPQDSTAVGDCQISGCEDGSPTPVDDNNDTPDLSVNKDNNCKECKDGNIANKADTDTKVPLVPSVGPSVTQVISISGAFGTNEGFGFNDSSLSCKKVCSNGKELYELAGDITPSTSWRVKVATTITSSSSSCSITPRTSNNISRTTIHEIKHRDLFMGIINNAKSDLPSLHNSQTDCEIAMTSKQVKLFQEFRTMTTRQNSHSDFSGEQRYYTSCDAASGKTVELMCGSAGFNCPGGNVYP